MSKRTVERKYQVYCDNPHCPKPNDSFQVRYPIEIDEEEDGLLKRGIRFSVNARVKSVFDENDPSKWKLIEHRCPWCKEMRKFKVPN